MLRSYLLLVCAFYLGLPATVARAGDSDDPMLALIAGEFALQEGAYRDAATLYLEAANASRDPALAERAARIALLADEKNTTEQAVRRWRELAPDAPAALQIDLSLAIKRGDAKAAERALNVLLGRSDWKAAVQVLAAEQESVLTPSLLTAAVRNHKLPGDVDGLLAFAGLAQRLELTELAGQIGEHATKTFPEEPRVWLWTADHARRQNEPQKARQALDRVLLQPALERKVRLAVAAQLDALGDPKAAAGVLATGEQDDVTRSGRAAYLARAKDDAALALLYAEVRDAPGEPNADRLFLLGQLAELQQLNEEALGWYQRVSDGESRDQATLRIAVILAATDRLDDAVARLRELQASDSENGEVLVDAYLLEAELQRKAGSDALAFDAFTRGLAIFEDAPELLYARALAYERVDKIAEAETDLRRIVAIDPENVDALNALGYTLADRTDRYDEAHGLIAQALKLQPDNPAIIDSMGWVLYRQGKLDEALPFLRRAFELQRDAEVAAHLGEALWASGRHDEARSVLRLGAEIDPENRAVKRALERLGS